MRNVSKALMAIFMLALLMAVVTTMAMAGTPPAPPTKPVSGGGSSGGSGGSSYTPSKFQSYTKPIKTSDGIVIGQFVGKDFNSVMVSAEENGIVGNASYDLAVQGELSSLPPDGCWLDIYFQVPGTAQLPVGMANGVVLGVVNVTESPNGWGYKSSPTYTLKMDGLTQTIDSSGVYYLVRSDGSNYQVQTVSLSDIGDGKASVQFNPGMETGVFTLVMAVTPTPTPTPTPIPTPTPTPTPMPLTANVGMFGVPIITFAVGTIVGAAALFMNTRRK